MPHPHPFVGRKTEIKQFESVLADPTPQAILIVGQQGMGKSMLARKFHDMALPYANTGGGSFVFQVRKDQNIGGTLENVLTEAKQAAHASFGLLRFTGVRQGIWSGLISLMTGGGGEIAQTLVGPESGDTARKFIRFLTEWGAKLPDDSRVLFVFDSDKYMPAASADSWRSLVEELPPKFKLVFAQRPDDVLARNIDFNHLADRGKLVRWEIGVLVDDDRDRCVAKLAEYRRPTASEEVVRAVFTRYDGHPFAVQGGLDLVALGTAIEDLPTDPTHPTEGIAAEQWRYVAKRGDEAMRLLKAYAVLEVPVPDDVARDIAGINRESFERLSIHDDFVSGLLAGADGDRQIYHSLLSEYVVRHVLDDEAEAYHRKAIDLFRRKLEHASESQTAPDTLAAERLAEHVLAADGVEAFVDCFVDECTKPLVNLGRLDATIDLSDRALGLVADDPANIAALSGNLGLIHQTRGDLDKAEQMFHKVLEIEENLGRLDSMANAYCNLGLNYQTRGDLDKAEEMLRKSLEINENLGRLEGVADQYDNLGLIYQSGDLDRAEEMHRKALKINEQLGRLKGMAANYGNLGVIYFTRGDLDKAEAMHRKSLDIEKQLGRLKGMANQYGNLGNVYLRRPNLDKAEKMYRKSLKINEQLGRLEGMADNYGNLGLIHLTRIHLVQAEEMLRKSLEINEQLGRLEGMANNYGNLGSVYLIRGDLMRGDLVQAEEMYRKSFEIEKKLGRLEGMADDYGNLGLVAKRRGDLAEARQLWLKARDFFQKIGIPHMVEKHQGWIDDLPPDDPR